jgi:hypothetical protein
MPRATQTSTPAAPFAKFTGIGDTLVGAYCGGKNRQRYSYEPGGAGKPMFKPDGKPMLEELMHLIAMPGTTAVTGNLTTGDTTPIEPGTEVRYAVFGFKWGQIIEARKSLPAAFGFKAGQTCSTDVYTITVVGYSAATENADGARKAGFTVDDGRIVMRTTDEHEKWVLNQIRTKGNANAAMDFEVSVRRYDEETEKEWGDLADEINEAEPWNRVADAAPARTTASPEHAEAESSADYDEEPF